MTQFKHHYTADPKNEWCTPDELFDTLNKVFSFTVDAAATAWNAKCKRWWGPRSPYGEDGLAADWDVERVFSNPPYRKGAYKYWIEKAAYSSGESVLIVPASWEAKAFIPAWNGARYFIFPYGRIAFKHPEHKTISSATFASLILVFGYHRKALNDREIAVLSDVGRVVNLRTGLLNG